MSTGGAAAASPARIHLDRGATWRNTETLLLAAKQDAIGLDVPTSLLYRLFGRRQADWYDDQLKAINGALVGELDLPGYAIRSVLDPAFGAVPDDSTDCTDAINEALAQVSTEGGGVVLLPPVENVATQRYRVNGTLEIPAGVVLAGCGKRSILTCRPGGGGVSVQFDTGLVRSGLRDLVMLGNSVAPLGTAIRLTGSQFVRVDNVELWDFETGIEVSDGTPFSAYNLIAHCEINRSVNYGIRIHQSANGCTIVGGRIFWTFDGSNGGRAIDIDNARAVCIVGVAMEAFDVGIRIANACSASITGCWMEKGANGPPGTARVDFLVDTFTESPFFEGDVHFHGNHHTDAWPIGFRRDRRHRTQLVPGDFTLGAGWGNTATIAVTAGSCDLCGRATITANGAGIAANPTTTLTFRDGTMAGLFFATVRPNGGTGATPSNIFWTQPTTTIVSTHTQTPVAGLTYAFEWQING